MGWRFRRSIKIAPGIRFFGEKGFASIGIGGRRALVTLGQRGATQTVGIAGTRLSHSTRIPSESSATPTVNPTSTLATIPPTRFGIERPTAPGSADGKRLALIASAILSVVVAFAMSPEFREPLLLVGLLSFVLAWVMPSRATLQARLDKSYEASTRLEAEQRRSQFRAAVENAGDDPSAVRAAIALGEELELTEKEVGYAELNMLIARAALLDFAAFVASTGGSLRPVEGHERAVAPHTCYFASSGVLYDKRGDNDLTGSLYLTEHGAQFIAPTESISVTWSETASVTRDYRGLLIQRRDRQNPTGFYFDSLSDAHIAEYVARRLWESSPLGGGENAARARA